LPAYQPEALLHEVHLARDNSTIQAENTADRPKTHPFSIFKTSQMFARDHDLISPDGGLAEIWIHHSCVQPPFLEG
jgi:hypothetical protein